MSVGRKFVIGSLRFQEGSRFVERENAPSVRLSHSEYAIFLDLCVTGFHRETGARRIDNLIYRIRKKLGMEVQILSDMNHGYRLLSPAKELPAIIMEHFSP